MGGREYTSCRKFNALFFVVVNVSVVNFCSAELTRHNRLNSFVSVSLICSLVSCDCVGGFHMTTVPGKSGQCFNAILVNRRVSVLCFDNFTDHSVCGFLCVDSEFPYRAIMGPSLTLCPHVEP